MDYEKKYKEANDKVIARFGTNVAKEIFTDLYESEDEKIRKELIKLMKQMSNTIVENYTTIEISTFVAWLEKQGQTYTKKDVDDAWLQGICDAKRELEKQGEQKPTDKVEPKFKIGDIITNKKSKDTVKIVQILHNSYCYLGWNGAATVHSDFNISEQDDWELVEQNPAWSEEDEKIMKQIDSLLYCQCKIHSSMYEKLHNWLKSLKPQSHWKPTEEQMQSLYSVVITYSKKDDYKLTYDSLNSLYNDLKKL